MNTLILCICADLEAPPNTGSIIAVAIARNADSLILVSCPAVARTLGRQVDTCECKSKAGTCRKQAARTWATRLIEAAKTNMSEEIALVGHPDCSDWCVTEGTCAQAMSDAARFLREELFRAGLDQIRVVPLMLTRQDDEWKCEKLS